ncbi:MAG: tRNA (N(6)-L-threonylcarbamoyladenosine(37)-C(2))-methylthiotransferase MtaB [Spirochaetales bacterium]|nr:tRNA (N(6)-L-threonylcarbamoyladenosine(37)-C(2))-methylthiotransferase MtaB [Spirochaetales bacterium]MCF7937105.1 tRNA (N(6)-L-threonylcarbamoyladenosine(37)-C(2))-methylthiotransferase MtaB [Spirochaetales bacterium]
MRAAYLTLGCKVNQLETEGIAAVLTDRGFSTVSHTQPADLVIVNTCTVTSKSEQKGRKEIRRLARDNPEALIVVTGCYAQLEPDRLAELGPNVRVLPGARKDLLLELQTEAGSAEGAPDIQEENRVRLEAELERIGVFDPATEFSDPYPAGGRERFLFHPDTFQFHSRAFLKIQDGCSRRCSYCRVPLARGASVSLDAASVVEQVRRLEEMGYREVVLTGININAYQSGKTGLVGLVDMLLELTGNIRFRLSSLEPEAINHEYTRLFALPRIAPSAHLSVQSGSDSVLKRMRRPYRAEKVRTAVAELQQSGRNIFIAADMIAGFPGETEEDHRQSIQLMRELGFSRIHVFPFSPRPDTEAFSLPGHVPEREVHRRTAELREVSSEQFRAYLRRRTGGSAEVILEKGDENGSWTGLSEDFLHVSVEAVPAGVKRGALILTEITDVLPANTGRLGKPSARSRFLEMLGPNSGPETADGKPADHSAKQSLRTAIPGDA